MLPIVLRCRLDNADEEVAELIAHLRKHPDGLSRYGQNRLGHHFGKGFADGIAEDEHRGLGRDGNGFYEIGLSQGADFLQCGPGVGRIVEDLGHQAELGGKQRDGHLFVTALELRRGEEGFRPQPAGHADFAFRLHLKRISTQGNLNGYPCK